MAHRSTYVGTSRDRRRAAGREWPDEGARPTACIVLATSLGAVVAAVAAIRKQADTVKGGW